MEIKLENLKAGIQSSSAEETQRLAYTLAQITPENTLLALYGTLGVGKTTFLQGFAQGLGITQAIKSPTFNLYSLYTENSKTLLHLDAYRLQSAQEFTALSLEEFLSPPYWIVVEWPENIEGALWTVNRMNLKLWIEKPGIHWVQHF